MKTLVIERILAANRVLKRYILLLLGANILRVWPVHLQRAGVKFLSKKYFAICLRLLFSISGLIASRLTLTSLNL